MRSDLIILGSIAGKAEFVKPGGGAARSAPNIICEGRYHKMTTTQMWVLLGAVAAAVLIFSALAHKKFTVREIAFIGVMAALSYVAYLLRIPNVLGTKSSFHLGNTFTALTALLLDGVSGGLAGAIGLSLADITAGDPGYAVTTFLLKFIIGLVCGTVAHRVFRLKEKQEATGHHGRYLAAVTAASFSGLLVNVFTDPLIGYFRDRYIFGMTPDISAVFMKVASGVTLVNSVLSCVCCVVLYLALRPALTHAGLLPESGARR